MYSTVARFKNITYQNRVVDEVNRRLGLRRPSLASAREDYGLTRAHRKNKAVTFSVCDRRLVMRLFAVK